MRQGVTAQIIPFKKFDDWEAAKALLREIIDKSDLTYEAGEWILVDVWPRLEGLFGVWQNIKCDGNEAADRVIEKALDNNLTAAVSSLILIEIELYTAMTGLLASRY